MSCATSGSANELQFVLSLYTRTKEAGECRGPVLIVEMSAWRVFTLEQIFDSQVATDVLWGGFQEGEPYGTAFKLCAAHWIDLAALLWMRASQQRRADWHSEADQLLDDVCTAAHWDPKEIVNMFHWQDTRLT